MASINDVNNSVNKINTTLHKVLTAVDDVNTSVQNEITSTNNVKTSVDVLDGDVKAGFATTDSDLKAIAIIEIATAKLLFHLTQQTDTMICALQQISQNTCGILTQVTFQTQLQKSIAEDIKSIREIEASVHPEAALELHRLAALRTQIEACCPPVQPIPACTYVACPAPKPMEMPPLPKIGNPTTGNQPG